MALSACPVISVLGSKRPQHRAWNFVVGSLWGIVSLPALEALLLQPGQRLVLGDARGLFLALLVVLTAVNYLPTRLGPAAVLLAVGQTMALAPYWPWCMVEWEIPGSVGGLGVAAVALSMAWGLARRRRHVALWDRLWLDFRDTFGLFWGLRVMERLNATSDQLGWEIALAWSGFRHRRSGEPLTGLSAEQAQALRQALGGLLRRFVSGAWLEERLHEARTRPQDRVS